MRHFPIRVCGGPKKGSKTAFINKEQHAEQVSIMSLKGHRETLLLVGRNATNVEYAKGQKICTALDVQPQGKFLKLHCGGSGT